MAIVGTVQKYLKICNLCEFKKISESGSIVTWPFITSVRTSKHYNPKFKWLRGKKVRPFDLPDPDKLFKNAEEKLKTHKIFLRHWKSRPLTLTTANEIFDPYEPPEGDGVVSKISKTHKLSDTSKAKVSEVMANRKIKSYDSQYSKSTFAQEAHDLYVKAHSVLTLKDAEELSLYATERAVSEMLEGLKNLTVKWQFIESLEPPKVVQTRAHELVVEKNLFAQVTVRFHTKQTLAIYDRFGRLIHGNEFVPKDVLEYVVFEKHINNEYGTWRLHAKIIPELKSNFENRRTHRVVEIVDDDEVPEDVPPESAQYPTQAYKPEEAPEQSKVAA